MDETNNSSLNVIENTGMQADPSNGLKQGSVASELTVIEPKMSQVVTNHATTSGISDPFQRDTLVATGVVSTTDTTSTVDSYTPGVLWFANAFVASRLKYAYAYYGSLVVTIQFNIPPGSFGTYIVSAVPSSRIDAPSYTELDGAAFDHISTARQNLHSIVSMASSSSVQIILPWLGHKDYQITSTETFTNWRVIVYCLAPLQLNTGSAGVAPYSIFVRGGADFKTLMPNFQSGKLSEVVGAVSGVASAVAKFPAAAPIAAPIAFITGLASRALSALGFTRHTQIESVKLIKHVAACTIVNIDGVDTGNVLALSSANTLTLEGFAGADNFDNMTFEHIFPRPTLIHQFTWSSTDAANTMFTNIGVNPFWTLNTGTTVRLIPAAYVGLPFTFWRGTMHYELIISASALMRGTLQIFWCPDSSAPAPALDISNILYNMICDIESNMTCRFTVGYNGYKPMLKNCIMSTSVTTNAFLKEFNSGYIGFKVINPLSSMNGAVSVNVSLFAWADSDMRFTVPRDFINASGSTTVDIPFPTSFAYQSGPIGKTLGTTERMVEDLTLVPSTPAFSVANALSGEEILSVRPLLQKFSRLMYTANPSNGDLLISTGPANCIDHFGNMRVNIFNGGDNPSAVQPYVPSDLSVFNWFRHYALLFDSMSGSTRYKTYAFSSNYNTGTGEYIESNVLVTPEILQPIVGTTVVESSVPMMTDFTIVEPHDSSTATEFTIPYYSTSYSQSSRCVLLIPSKATAYTNAAAGYRVDRLTYRQNGNGMLAPVTDNFFVNIFTAGGPDSKFNTFRRVPPIIFRQLDGYPTGMQSWVFT